MDDEKKECEICGEKGELYECERCQKDVCCDCTTSDYPMNVTYCEYCYDEWEELMIEHDFIY